MVYFENTTIFNTQLINAHTGTVLLLPEDGVHNHRNAKEQELIRARTINVVHDSW